MADLILDRRDIDFTLFEQFNLGELCKNQRYSDFNEDDFKMILDEATKLAREELSPANAIADRQGTTRRRQSDRRRCISSGVREISRRRLDCIIE